MSLYFYIFKNFHDSIYSQWQVLVLWISVSSKGDWFLSSCRPDYQPPLILPVTSEMVGEESRSEQKEFKILATSESDGFSEVGN